jgi:hypothetical protein
MTVLEPKENKEYTHWLWRHHSSYVLNETANRTSMIHTARCMHLFPPDESLDHIGACKRCADSIDELLRWAEEHEHTVVECTTCTPYDRTS